MRVSGVELASNPLASRTPQHAAPEPARPLPGGPVSAARLGAGEPPVWLYVLLLVSLRVAVTAYWIARNGVDWVEWDTALTASTITSVASAGQVVPAEGRIYVNGFLYQVLGATLAQITHLPVPTLQTLVFPFVNAATVVPIFALFAAVLPRPPLAALAALLVSVQADTLFTSARGSHEKFTYALFAVALWALVRGARALEPAKRLPFVLIFYAAGFGLACTNFFFASALSAAILGTYVLARLASVVNVPAIASEVGALPYSAVASALLIFMAAFYFYPPIQDTLWLAGELPNQIMLILFAERPVTTVYTTASSSWTSNTVLALLRSADALVAVTAAGGWLLCMVRLVRRRAEAEPGGRTTPPVFLLALFPVAGAQLVGGAALDLVAVSGINNLQIRLLPPFMFVAAPFVVLAVEWLWAYVRRWSVPAVAALGLLFCHLVVSGVALATREPLFSNQWLGYSGEEKAAVRWLHAHIVRSEYEPSDRIARTWAGPDFRIGELWLLNFWRDTARVPIVGRAERPEYAPFVMLSPRIRLASERMGVPAPDVRTASVIYDAGDVVVYHQLLPDGPVEVAPFGRLWKPAPASALTR